ncbi:MAG: hypothetical protein V7672_00180 [Brevundimonas sp.]|uniref:hypothetical protein n=1 Tax=Brevundimonas sp. TaxID=1871086 RepID=UPI003002AACA
MKTKAITQANDRLRRAKAALARVASASSFEDLSEAWSDFLLLSNGVYFKLALGAVGCGKSEAWRGRKRRERKVDELLQYLHQARNSDEHGIEPVAEMKGKLSISGFGYLRGLVAIPLEDGSAKIALDADPEVEVSFSTYAALVPVTNSEHGDTFQVPTCHLGHALVNPTPQRAGKLFVSYLERLIAEAAELPQRG